MEFTIAAYNDLLKSLKAAQYEFADYTDWKSYKKPVIMRHDVDLDLKRAADFSEIEKDGGVKATYFVLLTSNFYNLFSEESENALKKIMDNGGSIGLHFDEKRYMDVYGNEDAIREKIMFEAKVLSDLIQKPVAAVSMHRPSKKILDSDLELQGMINSYGNTFFRGFKYVSDSRRRWKEDVNEIIASGKYPFLHILTHPFWYNDTEIDLHGAVYRFVNKGNEARYGWLQSNITDLKSIMGESEVINETHG